MDYLTREFKNLYYTYQLFSSIEENIINYIQGLLPYDIALKINSCYIERNLDEGLLLVFNVLTMDLDTVYTSLYSMLPYYSFVKEVCPNFSHITLRITDEVLGDLVL